jgi:hypothetical protein
MVLLEVKGEVVERTALPMGKDDLVKGEMLTLGKWLARVVGVEGATPEKPVVLTKPPAEVSEHVPTQPILAQSQPVTGSPASQQQPAPYGERFPTPTAFARDGSERGGFGDPNSGWGIASARCATGILSRAERDAATAVVWSPPESGGEIPAAAASIPDLRAAAEVRASRRSRHG